MFVKWARERWERVEKSVERELDIERVIQSVESDWYRALRASETEPWERVRLTLRWIYEERQTKESQLR